MQNTTTEPFSLLKFSKPFVPKLSNNFQTNKKHNTKNPKNEGKDEKTKSQQTAADLDDSLHTMVK